MIISFPYDKECKIYFEQETQSIHSTDLIIQGKDYNVSIAMTVPEAYEFIERFQKQLEEYKNKHYFWKHTDKKGNYIKPEGE